VIDDDVKVVRLVDDESVEFDVDQRNDSQEVILEEQNMASGNQSGELFKIL